MLSTRFARGNYVNKDVMNCIDLSNKEVARRGYCVPKWEVDLKSLGADDDKALVFLVRGAIQRLVICTTNPLLPWLFG